MSKCIYKSNREFAPYDFLVSHRQLLLRSDKIKGYKENIDIIFFDTEYLELPTTLSGISLEESSVAEADLKIKNTSGKVVRVETDSGSFHIICSSIGIFENTLDFNETSLGVLEYVGRENEITGTSVR